MADFEFLENFEKHRFLHILKPKIQINSMNDTKAFLHQIPVLLPHQQQAYILQIKYFLNLSQKISKYYMLPYILA